MRPAAVSRATLVDGGFVGGSEGEGDSLLDTMREPPTAAQPLLVKYRQVVDDASPFYNEQDGYTKGRPLVVLAVPPRIPPYEHERAPPPLVLLPPPQVTPC